MAGAITGSWFPTGFHGHARSKSRNDIFQEYRQQAKPPPPEKLIKRLRESPLKHNFSKHDSQRVFHNSATYMENIPKNCNLARQWRNTKKRMMMKMHHH
ncbi:uncharacterized protein [Heterodontus francisci]|uniref:uncharacterized protein isoform X2 n=1 Tax=Heterodontus francisci TaxID=7792 RepID=UPI00355BAC51